MNPFFIIGNPRSGTSLLRLLLTCHPDLSVPPESSFMMWLLDKYKNWDNLDFENKTQLFIADLMASKKFEFWELTKTQIEESILEAKPKNYKTLINTIYNLYAKTQNKKLNAWGDKNNVNLNHINQIHKLFPNANFIYIIRDGRDVACSYIKLAKIKHNSNYAPKLPSDIHSIASEWQENNLKVVKSFESIPDSQTFTLKYENLVENTELVLNDICDFLKVNFDNKMLDFHKVNSTNDLEPKEFDSWKKKNKQKIDNKSIAIYKQELSQNEIQTFENIAYKMLEKFRYL